MNATFFDGKVSRPHPAQYTLSAYTVEIRYTDTDGQEQEVVWPLQEARLATWNPSGKTRLQFGPFPHQYLDVETADYEARFIPARQLLKPARPGLYEFVLSKGFRGVVLVGVVTVALLWVLYAYGIPALSLQVARQVPAEQEVALGDMLYRQLENSGQLPVDKAKTAHVERFWREMGVKTRLPIRIAVVESKDVNAFAVPGGHVVVFTGILKKFNRPEQLAALLAHEAAHVEKRHSLQQLIRSIAAYSIISVMFGDVSGITAVLVDNADNLVSLSYSRQHEAEADAFAVEQLARQGIDPMGAVWLMEALPTEGEVIPTLLRSHPHNAERVAATRALAKKARTRGNSSPELKRLWNEIKAAGFSLKS
ncbi:M48 family metallopeptidase [Rudanella lutea]|uniref:M48 family metallopeptidase n=1 Tax=Rudanella lutea TaxID=451374 RepID=UPI00037C0A73|nr:M48 family metallopeptidase [Rudanella lutea]